MLDTKAGFSTLILLILGLTACDEALAPLPETGPSDAMILDSGPPDTSPGDSALDAASGPVIVALDGSGDYPDLGQALAAGATDILVRAGTYNVSASVVFDRAGTRVRGEDQESVRFVQTNHDEDLFVVLADGVHISDLTLDTSENGQAAFVEGGANDVTLADTTILGGPNIFAIFFAGPNVDAGDATLDAYEAGALSRRNRLLRNTITSPFVGDGVAFALQAEGEVLDNNITGSMLSLYMLQDVTCRGNTVHDSATGGIFISLPSRDVRVVDNQVTDSHFAGIIIRPQLEHPAAGRMLDSTGIEVEGNTLRPEFFGFSVDGDGGDPTQGQLTGLSLVRNTIEIDDFAGIYLLRTVAPAITDNIITFTGADVSRRGSDGRLAIADFVSSGIYLELGVESPTLERNTITRSASADDSRVMQNAVVLSEPTVTEATLRGNTFERYTDAWVHSPCAADFGDSDRDGIYDRTGGEHTVEANRCEDARP